MWLVRDEPRGEEGGGHTGIMWRFSLLSFSFETTKLRPQSYYGMHWRTGVPAVRSSSLVLPGNWSDSSWGCHRHRFQTRLLSQSQV